MCKRATRAESRPRRRAPRHRAEPQPTREVPKDGSAQSHTDPIPWDERSVTNDPLDYDEIIYWSSEESDSEGGVFENLRHYRQGDTRRLFQDTLQQETQERQESLPKTEHCIVYNTFSKIIKHCEQYSALSMHNSRRGRDLSEAIHTRGVEDHPTKITSGGDARDCIRYNGDRLTNPHKSGRDSTHRQGDRPTTTHGARDCTSHSRSQPTSHGHANTAHEL